MRSRLWVVLLAAIVAITLGFVPADAQTKKCKSFRNTSAVGANDFTARATGTGRIMNASIKRLAGTRPFPDTALATPVNEVKWTTAQLSGPEIPVDSVVTVCAELGPEGVDISALSAFTRGGVEIGTFTIGTPYIVMNHPPGGSVDYVCTNTDPTHSVVLTNVVVRNHGDPASIYGPGEYTGGGTIVSSTPSLTLAPLASQTFTVGLVPNDKSCSIECDAAFATLPSDKYHASRADQPSTIVPGLRGEWLALLTALLLGGGVFELRRRRMVNNAR